MKSVNRNQCIDTIKGIACIAVVLIHYNWSSNVSEIIKTISRFAVPYFFFVSGYYLPNRDGEITSENLRRKIKHIFELAWKSGVIYAVFCIYWNSIMNSGWNLWTYTKTLVEPGKVIKFILSSDPFVYSHFWYIIALLACYLVLYPLRKMDKKLFLAGFLILLGGYILFAELKAFVGLNNFIPLTEESTLVVSNLFIFRAMPFLLWGAYLKKRNIAETARVPMGFLLMVVMVGCLLVIWEERHFGTILMYIGTHVIVLMLSVISVWYPNRKIGILAYIGDKLSMYVYIYHIMIGKIWDLVVAKMHLWGNETVKGLRPICVLAGTLLFAQLIVFFKSRKRVI